MKGSKRLCQHNCDCSLICSDICVCSDEGHTEEWGVLDKILEDSSENVKNGVKTHIKSLLLTSRKEERELLKGKIEKLKTEMATDAYNVALDHVLSLLNEDI